MTDATFVTFPRISVPRRLLSGVMDHFLIRRAEWCAASVTFWVGMIFLFCGNDALQALFSATVLKSYFTIHQCGFFLAFCGMLRLTALFINGTFKNFPWSPHLRIVGIFLSSFVWVQLALVSLLNLSVTPFLAVIAVHILAFDASNAYHAASEVDSKNERRQRNR